MDSIEETNRIRASLGLPLLPTPGGPAFKTSNKSKGDSSSSEDEPGSTLESRQAEGYDNWKKLQFAADDKKKKADKLEAIKRARDASLKYSKLEGRGLGEASEDEVDTLTWLKKQKSRRKKLEQQRLAKLEKELAERENQPEYTASDLAGVKVAHELDEFLEGGGEEQVLTLTLKDATIEGYDEEGDELENVELKEREALNERLAVKKKKPVYDPHAEEGEGGPTILKHYDEAIDGKKRKRFTLDGQGASMEEREALKQTVGEKLKAKPISLDILKEDVPISDYKEASQIPKKPKKAKKAKSTRQRAIDEDDIFPAEQPHAVPTNGDAMDIDVGNTTTQQPPSKPSETTSLVDDDELQSSLKIQRLAALKKRNRTKPEDVVRQIRDNSLDVEEPKVEEGGLIIDETTEFVSGLERNREEEKARSQATKPRDSTPLVSLREGAMHEDEDIPMGQPDNEISHEDEDISTQLKREISTPLVGNTGLEEEAVLDRGLGATLNLLASRGLVKKETSQDLNSLHRQRDSFLLQKQRREEEGESKARMQREKDRASGRFDRLSAREKEEHARQENRFRETQESRQMTEIFNREYKPDVQLKYVDEFGRSMNQKEAFKHLSHQVITTLQLLQMKLALTVL